MERKLIAIDLIGSLFVCLIASIADRCRILIAISDLIAIYLLIAHKPDHM